MRFTMSLSIHSRPPTSLVDEPQLCTRCSDARSQAAHQRRSCSVAPSNESPMAPATPAAMTRVRSLVRSSAAATPATNAAPAIMASVPTTVTPPELPGGTGRVVSSERGVPPYSVPISVAQVSAAAAARAPSAASESVMASLSAVSTERRTHAAKMPPLAMTCVASRSPLFARTPLVSCSLRLRPR
ncbi:MAG: hypothetical protein JWL95_964 [Gemmatimonadetes bacterium]|nr:hypothetical protein [Gemmatimonadota bacterium]